MSTSTCQPHLTITYQDRHLYESLITLVPHNYGDFSLRSTRRVNLKSIVGTISLTYNGGLTSMTLHDLFTLLNLPIEIWVKTQGDMSKIQTKKVVFFMIPIPKFILKRCLRPIRYFKFKEISLSNTWWQGIWIKVKRPILSWNFV